MLAREVAVDAVGRDRDDEEDRGPPAQRPVRAAVGEELPLFLDSGVRTGTDVATAIALGADFVFLGRAYLYGLMAGGQAGVERALELIGIETRNAMQLLGVGSPAELRAAGGELLVR